MDIRAMKMIRDREGHCITIKESEYAIAILNVHESNNSCKICEAETNSSEKKNIKIHNDSLRLYYCQQLKEKLGRELAKDLEELNTLNQRGLMNTSGTLCPASAEVILFSCMYRISNRIDHILGHKRNPNKFNRIETIVYVL